VRVVVLALVLVANSAVADERVVVRGSTPILSGEANGGDLPSVAEPSEQFVLRKVGQIGDVYELESTDAEDCVAGHSDVRVRVWAHERDLALVLRRAIDRVWPDGIELHVDAGTPVDDLGGGRYRLHADGIGPVLTLPRSAVGHSYHSSRTQPHELRAHRTGALWSLSGACGRYRLGILQGDFVEALEGAHLASIFGRQTALGDGPSMIPRDTVLYWPNGAYAGTVAAHLMTLEAPVTGSRTCFSIAIAHVHATLCAAMENVREVGSAMQDASPGLGEDAVPTY
jgi:hypothetical protein